MAELRYKHYLLTRFNILFRSGLPRQLKDINVAVDEKYLTERFRLFFKYTVPSIKNQTIKNFEWLVFFSDCTPYQFRQKIRELEKELPVFKPIFIGYGESIHSVIAEYIKQEQINFYITSRLDNDDALAADYIEKVQEYFINNKIHDKRVVVFNDGYQLDEKRRYLIKYHFRFNHFTSMLQPFNERKFDNILRYPHMEIEQYVPTDSVDTYKAMWIEVVHGTNICNRMKVSVNNIVRDKNALTVFGLNIEIKTKRNALYLLYSRCQNLIKIMRHGIKTILKKFIKSKKRK